MYFPEKFRTVVIRRRSLYREHSYVMRTGQFIPAFVEIAFQSCSLPGFQSISEECAARYCNPQAPQVVSTYFIERPAAVSGRCKNRIQDLHWCRSGIAASGAAGHTECAYCIPLEIVILFCTFRHYEKLNATVLVHIASVLSFKSPCAFLPDLIFQEKMAVVVKCTDIHQRTVGKLPGPVQTFESHRMQTGEKMVVKYELACRNIDTKSWNFNHFQKILIILSSGPQFSALRQKFCKVTKLSCNNNTKTL